MIGQKTNYSAHCFPVTVRPKKNHHFKPAFRVCGDHVAGGQGLTGHEPLALGVVQGGWDGVAAIAIATIAADDGCRRSCWGGHDGNSGGGGRGVGWHGAHGRDGRAGSRRDGHDGCCGTGLGGVLVGHGAQGSWRRGRADTCKMLWAKLHRKDDALDPLATSLAILVSAKSTNRSFTKLCIHSRLNELNTSNLHANKVHLAKSILQTSDHQPRLKTNHPAPVQACRTWSEFRHLAPAVLHLRTTLVASGQLTLRTCQVCQGH